MDEREMEDLLVFVAILASGDIESGLDPIEVAIKAFRVGFKVGHLDGHLCEEDASREFSAN